MEDTFICSSMNNSASYSNEKQDDTSEEESGWTAYFDDFFSSQKNPNHHDHQNSSSFIDDHQSSGAGNSSSMIRQNLVSDAASYVDYWKSSPKFSKKLNFKKTRTKEIYFDDSLEDTASSPVNSPKVGSLNMKEMGLNHRTTDDSIEGSMVLVKGEAFDHHLQVQTGRQSKDHEMVLQGRIKDESTSLRKKGMCLVPVSMLANYLG